MSIILDAIVLGIIVLCIAIAARKGFVRTFVEVAGYIAAVLIALSFGTVISGAVYDNAVSPQLVKITGETAATTAQELVDKGFEALPDVISENADKFGISKDSILQKVTELDNGNVSETVERALDATIRPIFVKVFGMLCTVLLFILLLFLVHLLAKLLNKLFSFSIVGKLNRTLGGIIGFVEGTIFALIFCMLVGFIASVSNGFLGITHEAVDSTHILRFLLSITPFTF